MKYLVVFQLLSCSFAFLHHGTSLTSKHFLNILSAKSTGFRSCLKSPFSKDSGMRSIFPSSKPISIFGPFEQRAVTIDDGEVETTSGPVISVRKRAVVEAFVNKMGGKRVIQRILIANNGMAATKAILSMRQWAYMTLGDERAIEFIAMATRDDLNANAEFIRLADAFVEVPSGSNKNNYANVPLIVEIAESQKVDGVWPGWGHASENPALPSTLSARGIQFIGPTASVMDALGDKISANILAQTARVPSIPWSGDGITSGLNEEGVIPKEAFDKACVFTVEQAATTANKIGYPVMIKASEGGGGKGIRMARDVEELKTNFIQVQNEVPGSPIFMMQLCTNARHLEVQIVGDEYGNAVALNGRDCSTQRRFQKIFEEGPPIVAPREVFREMELAAQRLTQSIGYIGAGTVEYLFNAATNKYYFLELNPRLQVEHPVTEGLTGINLPATQLQVAMGISLDRMPEVRQFYGRDPSGSESIDFFKDQYQYPDRHVIAARITAENPDEGFKPTSGRIERVKFQSTPKVWGYFSVGANGGIHEYADSQFGHLFASGPTREDARKALVLALKEIDVRGDIRTTVEYLIKLLETTEFKDNTIDTSWLDGLIREKSVSLVLDPHVVALGAAVYRAHAFVKAQIQDQATALSRGQTSLMGLSSLNKFPIEITYENIKYSFAVSTLGQGLYRLTINDQVIEARIREQPDKSLLCSINGENYQLFGQEEALGLRMKINGATVMIPVVYNPSELRSDVTGKIVRFLQQDGEVVEKDKPFVEVEAMKMIMSLKASETGAIAHALSPGSILSAGDLIATLKLKDPSRVKQISAFNKRLSVAAQLPAMTVEDAVERLSLALDGFNHDANAALQTYLQSGVQYPDTPPIAMSRYSKPEEVMSFFSTLLNKFLAAEKPFAEKDEAQVISELVKAAKDSDQKLQALVPVLFAHKQLKSRAAVVVAILRQLEPFPSSSVSFLPDLVTALKGLAALPGALYGEVSLKAQQLLDDNSTPPFQVRLDALKSALLEPGVDVKQLSKQPNLAVSVDLLTVLFQDADEHVRKVALEVYIRRVYRAHCIDSIRVEEKDGVLTAAWAFSMRETTDKPSPPRQGFMASLKSFGDIGRDLPTVLSLASSQLKRDSSLPSPINVLHIGYPAAGSQLNDDQYAATAQASISKQVKTLQDMGVRNVNILISNPGKRVSYFNYYHEQNFKEDPISRNMRPTFTSLLELNRLVKNFDLIRMPTVGRNSQIYLGSERVDGVARGSRDSQQVLFLRAISNSQDTATPGGADRVLSLALDELERAVLDPRVTSTSSSRVYLNVLAEFPLSVNQCVQSFMRIMDELLSKYATRLLTLRIDEIEVKLRVTDPKQGVVPVRLVASSATGGWLTRTAYREYLDPVTGQTEKMSTISGADEQQEMWIVDPYPTANKLQIKRASARRVGSTYAPDFLGLLQVNLLSIWQRYLDSVGSTRSPPPSLFTFEELVVNKNGELQKEKRLPATNKIGMLAWHCFMKTPQYPDGREIVVISNDVTVQSGSFGVQEDEFFFKASEYARVRGLPRVYISCNSGARIGLVEELKSKFKVTFKDENNPLLGFENLYLTEEDYLALPKGTVDATLVVDKVTGENKYVLDAIIGTANGIGVENLRGSGLIAGETSRAYDETFTLSYVTGRSVGIGAYLNRLGQRVIQMQQGPMILTGYSALNKLLGKEVYTSQDQLGGPQIMYPNGVTHEVVQNDQEGMKAVLDWLSYTPATFTSTAPAVSYGDPVDRPIAFQPTKTPYDPRHMLGGVTQMDGTYVSGFFDKGSFKEYLGGWGKSVVVGRARLGGQPVGVISVETRLVEQRIPADPGNPDSREAILPQAGQVWYPDSAFKTAQAIQDFNRGENLPLIVFANWRGFSGGTRDMYGEVLKYGAMIVDALRTYRHPVFVYIPPNGELRGGAWVVIDPTINPAKMEMYADVQSRGGILEPPGICEVKYRAQDQKQTMHRLDPVLTEMDAITTEGSKDLSKEIAQREKNLAPLYTQIAHEFADLHDRTGRMLAKGCIRQALTWSTSRRFFYWRIRCRLLRDALVSRVANVSDLDPTDKDGVANKLVLNWLDSLGVGESSGSGDEQTARFLESDAGAKAVDEWVSSIRANRLKEQARSALEALKTLSPSDLESLIVEMKKDT